MQNFHNSVQINRMSNQTYLIWTEDIGKVVGVFKNEKESFQNQDFVMPQAEHTYTLDLKVLAVFFYSPVVFINSCSDKLRESHDPAPNLLTFSSIKVIFLGTP